MINTKNYFDTIKGIEISSLPDNLKKGHEFILKSTENNSNWRAYENGENTRKVIDAIFQRLDEWLSNQKPKTVPKPETIRRTSIEKESNQRKETAEKKPKVSSQPQEQTQEDEEDFLLVDRIPDEIKFIRRFLSMNGKKKTKEDFLRFINALHRSIIEKKIRKSSRYAKQIEYIQNNLIKTYNNMTKPLLVEIKPSTINEFKSLIASEKVMPSVRLIKRYISLNGKYGVKDKANKLITAMTNAFQKGLVKKKEQNYSVYMEMYNNLTKYVKSKNQKILSIGRTELNGLNGVLDGCGCSLQEEDEPAYNTLACLEQQEETARRKEGVMNSMDFQNVRFKTLGFVGKYRRLIGDPAPGFTAMVYGKPKMGKSFLCVDFAGYLARNHGRVLYIAKEEGLDFTLQEKIRAKDVAHPNLDFSGSIPEDLSDYQFIFLDSVNKLGLSAEDLEALKTNNPDKSFIYIFQSTKDGNFRGANEFQHDVDVVIEVPEKGLAIQNGRFNQGGEMRIFEEEYRQAA